MTKEMKPEFQELNWCNQELRHVVNRCDELQLKTHKIACTNAEEMEMQEFIEQLAYMNGEAMVIAKRFAWIAEQFNQAMKRAEEFGNGNN